MDEGKGSEKSVDAMVRLGLKHSFAKVVLTAEEMAKHERKQEDTSSSEIYSSKRKRIRRKMGDPVLDE